VRGLRVWLGGRLGWAGSGAHDCADVFVAQCGSQPPWHEAVDDLHVLDVAGIRHHFEHGGVKGLGAHVLDEFGGTDVVQQLRVLAIGAIGVAAIHSVHFFHDSEAGGAECVGEQEGAGIGPVRGDARGRKLMVVIGREGAADHGAGGGELAGDGGMLDVRDALGTAYRVIP